ncbi:hypothetical protein Mal4_40850 [Maioricimonas rarisocia]|uniref:Uncharacterized protein n=1 Tax=Maioricimonas rarisocia TaxID=2528026 RepID=A0A517ZB98_9PLAN|nr:hypothetical protein [Maioricimonas rarisocia]QDU39738.1 hypothetical protein Mal4_40850 [Maioricimonas rarisocia]
MFESPVPYPLPQSPSLTNPYWSRATGAIALAAGCGLVSLVAIVLPGGGTAATITASLAAGAASIALVCGLVFAGMARQAQPHVDGLMRGETVADWTFSAETWNAFAERMQSSHITSPTVPRSLPPVIGLAICPTLAIAGLGWTIPFVLVAAGLITWGIIRLERQHGRRHYPLMDAPARILISRDVLATPGGILVWNGMSPRLVNVTLSRREELVFHIASHGHSRATRSEIVVPVPFERRVEARQVVAALCNRPLAELATASLA